MSGFGVFEVDEFGDESRMARTAARRRSIDTATHLARRTFGAYLGNARSSEEWNDRLSQVIGDMSFLVEKHASLMDLDKVVATLRAEAEGRHFNPAEPDGEMQWAKDEKGNGYHFGDPGAWSEWGYVDTDGRGNPTGAGYFPLNEESLEDDGESGHVSIPVDGLNLDQTKAEAEKASGDWWGDLGGGGGRHRASSLPYRPRNATRRTADDDQDGDNDSVAPEGFDNQELLDDWPLPSNPVDDSFDGDENDLQSDSDDSLGAGGKDVEVDLVIEAGAHNAPAGAGNGVQWNSSPNGQHHWFDDPTGYGMGGSVDSLNGSPARAGYSNGYGSYPTPTQNLSLDGAQAEVEKMAPQNGFPGRHRANRNLPFPVVARNSPKS